MDPTIVSPDLLLAPGLGALGCLLLNRILLTRVLPLTSKSRKLVPNIINQIVGIATWVLPGLAAGAPLKDTLLRAGLGIATGAMTTGVHSTYKNTMQAATIASTSKSDAGRPGAGPGP